MDGEWWYAQSIHTLVFSHITKHARSDGAAHLFVLVLQDGPQVAKLVESSPHDPLALLHACIVVLRHPFFMLSGAERKRDVSGVGAHSVTPNRPLVELKRNADRVAIVSSLPACDGVGHKAVACKIKALLCLRDARKHGH
jgi:hypothetical protein